jgi:hypothetical protein
VVPAFSFSATRDRDSERGHLFEHHVQRRGDGNGTSLLRLRDAAREAGLNDVALVPGAAPSDNV